MSSGVGFLARSVVRGLDAAWCRAVLATVGDRPGLLSFLFHAVSAEGDEGRIDGCVDPAQTLSPASLSRFISYFAESGYEFISPAQIMAGLGPDGRYVLMTFDDGYFNNVRVLPVLEEYDVPATFFISTNYVREGKAYWWDVVYRERLSRGESADRIREEQLQLKKLTHDRVEEYLTNEFGAEALRPVGDEDRPMTETELGTFAQHPLVQIGNHTADHAILTNYSPQGIQEQIQSAQDVLQAVTGARPTIISYPNGNYSDRVVDVTRRCGLGLGVTVDQRRGGIPRSEAEKLRIGRFCFTRGQDEERTYLGYRSSASPRRGLRRMALKLRGRTD